MHGNNVGDLYWIFLTCLSVVWSAGHHHQCPALDDPSVRHVDIRLSRTTVPHLNLTTYICQTFQVPAAISGDVHAVAFQPLIDNADVMHHMILFSCPRHGPMTSKSSQPHACVKEDGECRSWVAQWSRGMHGTRCVSPEAGVPVSAGVELLLQIHWNNAQYARNMTDSSGMRVFYTSRLRPHDLGHVQVGQQEVVIPPGVSRHAQSGGCSAECTGLLLPHPIYLTHVHLHMHYLGAGGWVEVVGSDGDVTQLTYDNSYDVDHPPVHHLSSPVIVKPGDYVRVTCLFSSKEGNQQRNTTVYFGEGSDGEMCYAFLAYYPAVPGFHQCLQLTTLDFNCLSPSYAEFQDCSLAFPQTLSSKLIPEVMRACGIASDLRLCSGTCQQALDNVTGHHCLQGQLAAYLQRTVLSSVPGWATLLEARDSFIATCGALSVM